MNDANDTNVQEDLSGPSDVHKTLSDAAEVIAAFIGAANSEEIPVGSLMEAMLEQEVTREVRRKKWQARHPDAT